MNKLRALTVKALSLKTRVAKFGAPYGNKNAAGPHDGSGSAPDLTSTKSTSAYRVPSIDGMRATLQKAGINTTHISKGRSLLDQRQMLLELMKKHKLDI